MILMQIFLTGKNMRVFMSWLIANLETLAVILVSILIYSLLEDGFSSEFFANSKLPNSLTAILVGGILVGLTEITDSIIGRLVGFLISIFVSLGIFINCGFSLHAFIPCLIVSFVVGIYVAVYAWRNFYDVVSLRWLYANSDAAIFESTLLYSISRFVVGVNMGLFVYTFSAILIAGYR